MPSRIQNVAQIPECAHCARAIPTRIRIIPAPKTTLMSILGTKGIYHARNTMSINKE